MLYFHCFHFKEKKNEGKKRKEKKTVIKTAVTRTAEMRIKMDYSSVIAYISNEKIHIFFLKFRVYNAIWAMQCLEFEKKTWKNLYVFETYIHTGFYNC